MRNLTIKRDKSFVACLMADKVYMEDSASSEITINNVPCRLLGTLKNGEQKTFSIPQEETKIFVIADKLSKNFCNEVYTVPAGEENVFLSGRNHFNPASGNAFRFDGNIRPETLENRKKGNKIGWIILAAAVVLGIIVGLVLSVPGASGEAKEFVYEQMHITLNDYFKETSSSGFDVCYESRDIAVFVLKETLSEDKTLEEYGEMVISANDMDSSVELQEDSGLYYFEYDYAGSNPEEAIGYFAAVFKNGEDYWLIQFACYKESYQGYRNDFVEWSKSVRFE